MLKYVPHKQCKFDFGVVVNNGVVICFVCGGPLDSISDQCGPGDSEDGLVRDTENERRLREAAIRNHPAGKGSVRS